MINPLRSVILNNRYYRYDSDTYHEDMGLKNSSTEAQNSRHFNSVLGKSPEVFNLAINLWNTDSLTVGESVTGSTTWLGVSRLYDLKNFIGANGVSMPLVFVTPYGVTYSVVPTGKIGIDIFNPSNPQSASAEFRVTLTLEST